MDDFANGCVVCTDCGLVLDNVLFDSYDTKTAVKHPASFSLQYILDHYPRLHALYYLINDISLKLSIFSGEITEKVFFNCFNIIARNVSITSEEKIQGHFMSSNYSSDLKIIQDYLGSNLDNPKCRNVIFISFSEILFAENCPRLPKDIAYFCEATTDTSLLHIASSSEKRISDGSAWRPTQMISSVCNHLQIPPSLRPSIQSLLQKMEIDFFGRHPDTLMAAAIYAILSEVRKTGQYMNEQEKRACELCLSPENDDCLSSKDVKYYGCYLFKFLNKCKASVLKIAVPNFKMEVNNNQRIFTV